MILISHRGNVSGKDYTQENSDYRIRKVLDMGYDVEIDVWFLSKGFHLGHDYPEVSVSDVFLETEGLWIHCKNAEALSKLSRNPKCNCFFHNRDEVVLTSKLYLWTYPGALLADNSICVLPELFPNQDISKAVGVCSDYIERYK